MVIRTIQFNMTRTRVKLTHGDEDVCTFVKEAYVTVLCKRLFFFEKKKIQLIFFFFKWDPCSSKQMRERAQGCDINEVLYRILCISDCFPLWKLSCKMFLSLNVLSLSLDVTFYIVVHSELSTLFSVPEMIIWCSFNSWPYTNFSSNSPVLGGIQGIRDHNVFTQN